MSTAEELQTEITSLMTQIAGLGGPNMYINSEIENYKEENLRIEKYLSDFTSRQGILLTIAGLFTLLPLTNPTQINYFLIWSVPFLLLAIIFYMLSAKRVAFIVDNIYPLEHREINKKMKETFFHSMFLFKITDSLLTMFFLSFIINYYLISFLNNVEFYYSVLIFGFSILIGILRYAYVSELFKKSNESAYPTGGYYSVPTVPTPDNYGKY